MSGVQSSSPPPAVGDGEDDPQEGSVSPTVSAGHDGVTTHGIIRQSPPPLGTDPDGYDMPPGAIISPPESASSSDEEGEEEEQRETAVSQRPIISPPDSDTSSDEDDNWRDGDGDRLEDLRQAISRLPLNDTSLSDSEADTSWPNFEYEEAGQVTPPPRLRKRDGQLVRPALRPPSNRRSSSMPGSPEFSKAVHFDSHLERVRRFLQIDEPYVVGTGLPSLDENDIDIGFPPAREPPRPSLRSTPSYPKGVYHRREPSNSDLEHVRHFLKVDRPLSISAGTSLVDSSDSEDEFPFREESWSSSSAWEMVTAIRPTDSSERETWPVWFEEAWLSTDKTTMVGLAIITAHQGFERRVMCRYTLDSWKSVSEIDAEFFGLYSEGHSYSSSPSVDRPRQDRYTFSIKLPSSIDLITQTVYFCMRYNVDGQDFWDNNGGSNFKAEFRKKPRPRKTTLVPRTTTSGSSRAADYLARHRRPSAAGISGNPSSTGSVFAKRYDLAASLEQALADSKDRDPGLYAKPEDLSTANHGEKSTTTTPDRAVPSSSVDRLSTNTASYEELIDKYIFFESDPNTVHDKLNQYNPERTNLDDAFKDYVAPDTSSNFVEATESRSKGKSTAWDVFDWINEGRELVSQNDSWVLKHESSKESSKIVDFEGSSIIERPGITSRETKPEMQESTEREYDDMNSDNSSDISSLWSTPTSDGSSATSGLPSEVRFSMQELADVILDDAGLATILEAATSHPSLQSGAVHTEFKKLMGNYYRDLKKSSTAPDLDRVARLFKKSSGIISNEARKLLGLVHAKPFFADPREKMSQREKNEVLQYLWERVVGPGIPDESIRTLDVPGDSEEAGVDEKGEVEDDDEDEVEDDVGDGVDDTPEDDMYPEISAAVAFLKDGIPMQKFQESLRKFVLDTVRDHDVQQYPKSLPRSLPNLVDEIWGRLRLSLPEPRIPKGRRRIRWTCSCGVRLYDDFDEQLDSAALVDLQTRLNKGNLTKKNNEETSPLTRVISQVLRWTTRPAQLLKTRPRSQASDTDLPTYNTTATLPVENPTRTGEPIGLLYILYCTSTGTHGAKFHQSLIHESLNDQELFKLFRTIYCRARKETSWFTLRTTTNISLCKFFVDHSRYASVRRHDQGCMQGQPQDCVCLPPESLVGREYQCHPVPPNLMPPFEKNYLMHYFLHPEDLSPDQAWAFTQLPKRMNDALQPGTNSFLPGWGIYFEEGWHFKTIYLLVSLATVIGSLIFGVCWSVFKLDVQAAFGITSYWVAVVGMGIGFLALRSTNKI